MSQSALNDIDIDHVFAVDADGKTSDVADVWAPESVEGETIDDVAPLGWETVTDGYTGQQSYSGAVMHDSEFIGKGSGLESAILSTPGIYVTCGVSYDCSDCLDSKDGSESCDSCHGEMISEGWVVLRKVTTNAEQFLADLTEYGENGSQGDRWTHADNNQPDYERMTEYGETNPIEGKDFFAFNDTSFVWVDVGGLCKGCATTDWDGLVTVDTYGLCGDCTLLIERSV